MKDVFFIKGEPQQIPEWLSQAILEGTVIVHGDSGTNVQHFIVNGEVASVGNQLIFDGTNITINS